MASQVAGVPIAYSTVYSDTDQRKRQRSASLAFVRGIHHGPVNSPHKGPVTWKMFPFDDVMMCFGSWYLHVMKTRIPQQTTHRKDISPAKISKYE